jgi:hypothetical protein
MNGTVHDRADEGAEEVEITPKRLDELVRWHGTDEGALPPAHTLQYLSRDTVAALRELACAREKIARLRVAMGRAFWAASRRELNAILLAALGPPPQEPAMKRAPRSPHPPAGGTGAAEPDDTPLRLDAGVGRGPHHPGSVRSPSSRAP